VTAGCASKDNIVHLQTVESVPPTRSAIFPPPGGPSIITVLERNNPDGMQQTILLSTSSTTPGDSYFKIRLSSGQTENLKDQDPRPIRSAADLDRELLAAFPGTKMVPSGTVLQNAFGPFSYASGQGVGGEACVYAWQQITPAGDYKAALTSLDRIQIRFRMCDAQRSERDLLMVMYGFTITAAVNRTGWNPYGMTALPQSVAPLSDGIVLPARAATVCELGVASTSECIFAPEQTSEPRPVRMATAENSAAARRSDTEAKPEVTAEAPTGTASSEAAPISVPAPLVPLPPTREFTPSVPSPPSLPEAQPVGKVPPPTPTLQAARVPSPSSLGGGDTSELQSLAPPDQVAEAQRNQALPPRMIDLSVLPSSLRPKAAATAAGEVCKTNEGNVCPQ